MEKKCFELKCGQSGFFVDGRFYKIHSIPSITMCSDGGYKYGDIEIYTDDEDCEIKMSISEFVENVKTIGNLTIR